MPARNLLTGAIWRPCSGLAGLDIPRLYCFWGETLDSNAEGTAVNTVLSRSPIRKDQDARPAEELLTTT